MTVPFISPYNLCGHLLPFSYLSSCRWWTKTGYSKVLGLTNGRLRDSSRHKRLFPLLKIQVWDLNDIRLREREKAQNETFVTRHKGFQDFKIGSKVQFRESQFPKYHSPPLLLSGKFSGVCRISVYLIYLPVLFMFPFFMIGVRSKVTCPRSLFLK